MEENPKLLSMPNLVVAGPGGCCIRPSHFPERKEEREREREREREGERERERKRERERERARGTLTTLEIL
jgi:hypothetical protein